MNQRFLPEDTRSLSPQEIKERYPLIAKYFNPYCYQWNIQKIYTFGLTGVEVIHAGVIETFLRDIIISEVEAMLRSPHSIKIEKKPIKRRKSK